MAEARYQSQKCTNHVKCEVDIINHQSRALTFLENESAWEISRWVCKTHLTKWDECSGSLAYLLQKSSFISDAKITNFGKVSFSLFF